MSTLTKTLFTALFAVVVLTTSSFTSSATTGRELAAEVKGFNKIWVSGNVKVELTQSEKEGVFIDENFDANKTSVMRKGQTLYINSMEASQVTIKVSLKDLQRIEAAGNAVVVTTNKFDVKYLQLFLSQSATAKVNAIAGDLYTEISEEAKLKVSGVAEQHTLIASNMANVKFSNFVSMNTDVQGSVLAADKNAFNQSK